MKHIIFFISFSLFVSIHLFGQITLEECRQRTIENYPLIRQYELIEKAQDFNIENASRGYIPQLAMSAKASYQSEVTKIPFDMPGVDMKGMPKAQYQVMLELQQTIWDGGAIHSKKKLTEVSSQVDREQVSVNLYALNDRVDQLYFGVLLLNEQLIQNSLYIEDLQNTLNQINAYMQNGIANSADVDAVKVELLSAAQKRIELEETKQSYIRMLSLFMGEELQRDIIFIKPIAPQISVNNIARPELLWYEAQSAQLYIQEKTLQTGYMPKFGLFVQGAYGNPGLDMLKGESSPFYIAGVRMSWNFGSLYTLRNDKKIIANNLSRVANNRDTFLFNTRLEVAQQDGAIESIRKQMKDDDKIIRLRINIRNAAEAKVANGVLTVTEMLREITAESNAKQTKAIHEIQLLMNLWKLKYTLND